MSEPVLVDTSVWIDYFRGDTEAVRQVNDLIDRGRIRLSGVILQEVLQGSRDAQAFKLLEQEMKIWPYENEVPEDFIVAARMFAKMRWEGITIPPTNCLVAAVALRRDLQLLARDQHFERIAELGVPAGARLRLMR